MRIITFKISEELLELLDHLVKLKRSRGYDVTRSDLIRRAIVDYVTRELRRERLRK